MQRRAQPPRIAQPTRLHGARALLTSEARAGSSPIYLVARESKSSAIRVGCALVVSEARAACVASSHAQSAIVSRRPRPSATTHRGPVKLAQPQASGIRIAGTSATAQRRGHGRGHRRRHHLHTPRRRRQLWQREAFAAMASRAAPVSRGPPQRLLTYVTRPRCARSAIHARPSAQGGLTTRRPQRPPRLFSRRTRPLLGALLSPPLLPLRVAPQACPRRGRTRTP